MISWKKMLAIMAYCGWALWSATPVSADNIIPNAYLWGTSPAFFIGSGGADTRTASNTVNGGGMTGLTSDTSPGQMWIKSGAGAPTIEWALPRNFNLSDIQVWNYNETGNLSHGLQNVEISVASSLAGSYTSLGTYTFTIAPGTSGYGGFLVSSLSGGPWSAQSNIRKIKFTPTSSFSNTSFGLSEVRFLTTDSLSTAPTALATPISTVTVQGFSSQDAGNSRLADDSINGNGLVGALHNSNAGDMWQTSGSDGGNPFITYDLGSPQSLGRVRIWSYSEVQGHAEASHIRLLVSPDNNPSNLVTVGEFQAYGRNAAAMLFSGSLDTPSFDLDFTSLTAPQLALLSNVELVRLQILSSSRSELDFDNGVGIISGQRSGFAEVQFFNQEVLVPEPSTYALGLIGLAGLGLVVWRQRRQGK